MTHCLVTIMSSNSNSGNENLNLTDFVIRFFKASGAVMEKKGNQIDLLLPEATAAALDVEEEISLTESPEEAEKTGRENCYAIQFQSPLLDRIVSMAGAAPPFLQANLSFTYIKSQGFENLINEQFSFYKSKIKKTATAESMTWYLLLTCRYLAQSDEQKQGLIDFSLNLDTMALTPGMSDMLVTAEKVYHTGKIQTFSDQQIKRIHELVQSWGPSAVEAELNPFKRSMNRRYRRDCASLDTYYKSLEKEMEDSLDRSGLSDKVIQERKEKIAMIPEELAAKKRDLLNKYSIKLSFEPAAAVLVTTPCVRVSVTVMSGRHTRTFPLIYNPVTKEMDPWVCSRCGSSTYALGLDDKDNLCCTDCL